MLVEPSAAADVVRVMIEALGGDAATSYAQAMAEAEAQRARVARERAAALDVAREGGRASTIMARAEAEGQAAGQARERPLRRQT